uniref:Uncharacterized protein n=1 Tax=Romanomermis culicivorax TaxID=13658 RepID=A0A915HX73_ROMCU
MEVLILDFFATLILPDAGPYAYRTKTFHLATLSKVQGRVNLQPWYSEQDRKSPDYDLIIIPNFETAYYDLTLLPPLMQTTISGGTGLVNCSIIYSCIGHEEQPDLPVTRLEYNATNDEICQWPSQKLTPGRWYRFRVYRNAELVVHCWQTVKPAFDADAFKVKVDPTESGDGIEVDVGTHQYSLLWQSFIGHAGEILVNLLGGDKVKTSIITLFNHFKIIEIDYLISSGTAFADTPPAASIISKLMETVADFLDAKYGSQDCLRHHKKPVGETVSKKDDDSRLTGNPYDRIPLPVRKNIPSLDENQQYPLTRLEFRDLIPGHCYTAEVMAAADCVVSFNRTWFNVRLPAKRVSIALKNVTVDSAVVKLRVGNGNSSNRMEQDASCTTILTLEQKDCGTRYIFMGQRRTAVIVGLKPNVSYTLGGVNQCGHLTDVCRLDKSPIEKVVLTTKTA